MIADVLSVLAAMVHGGPLVAFALLINFRGAIPRVTDEDVIRVYRAFGGGFGHVPGRPEGSRPHVGLRHASA